MQSSKSFQATTRNKKQSEADHLRLVFAEKEIIVLYSVFSDTIAAISTPRGCGGIAVIRISGDDAISVADKFIVTKCKKTLAEVSPNSAVVADMIGDDGKVLDTGVVTVFRTPKSFTGEDTVEISCHGGVLITESVLARALSCGAVQAGPGEFTRRAFSAGKISLSQAESISDLITAKSHAALRLSRINASGALAEKTDEIYDDIKNILSAVYAGIDFPDEDLSPVTPEEMRDGILKATEKLRALKNSYKAGHAVVEGIKTVICGKPNTGKSTLLNLLCKSDRAIVTDIAGTTRDVITESVVCGNAALLISDTAGIRETSDMIEAAGVKRSIDSLSGCELIFAVFDGSSPLDDDDEKIIQIVSKQRDDGACAVAILNKADKGSAVSASELDGMFDAVIRISANDPSSYETAERTVAGLFNCGSIGEDDSATVTSARQYAKICTALEATESALAALQSAGEDFAGGELEIAMAALGELDGRAVGIDIVDDIFSKFCVGK